MTAKNILNWADVRIASKDVAVSINDRLPFLHDRPVCLYGVPRGGIPAALAVKSEWERLPYFSTKFPHGIKMVDEIHNADIIVDDLIDSGKTMETLYFAWDDNRPSHRIIGQWGPDGFPFFALFDKRKDQEQFWYVFPWEVDLGNKDSSAHDSVTRFLQAIGEDVQRDGLLETPQRVVKSWGHLYSGYRQDPADALKEFVDDCDEMVLLKNIEFYSTCEHHLQPFYGKAHIAYIPNGRVVGISKLARVLEIYARRLQIQERICQQVTSALNDHLQPKGAACILEGKHFCMMCRGVEKQGSTMITSSLTGAFREAVVRSELFSLIRGS
jgi:GTP cyclohydrolase I